MKYKIKYPEGEKTDEETFVYLLKVEEKLKQVHNIEGKKYRENKKTEKDWRIFKNEYLNKHEELVKEKLKYKKRIQNKVDKNIDFNNSFIKEK